MSWFDKFKRHQRKPQIPERNKAGQIIYSAANLPSTFSTDIETNLRLLKDVFKECDDLIFREFICAQQEPIKLALIYVDGLTNKGLVSDQIMKALALELPLVSTNEEINKANALQFIKMRGLCIHQVRETNVIADAINTILSGDTLLLVDGHDTAIINGSREWASRGIEESKTEVVVRGPKEAFVETLLINTSLLRRKIKNPNLKIEFHKIGEQTKTDIAVVYLVGVVQEGLVQEVKNRLERIKIDGILESGYIEDFIRDSPGSPFSTVFHTDRPDRVAANLLEGRLAIMVDGTPIVLTVPSLFLDIIQNPEDYYENYQFAIAARILRFATLFISLLVPSLYIAVINFHPEMIPTPLLLSIAAQREAVPFPLFIEILVMEVVFEVLREAGIRLPRPAGQAVSIVGALIVGQAAVQAGLVSAATVIVVALTGISSFTLYYGGSLAIRLIRFPLMFLAAALGLFGLISGVVFLVIHLASLRSFGVPFLSPVAPKSSNALQDTAARYPWWGMRKRPQLIGHGNPERVEQGLRPEPPG